MEKNEERRRRRGDHGAMVHGIYSSSARPCPVKTAIIASLSCSYVALVELQVAAETRLPKGSTNADWKVRKNAANPIGTVGSGKNSSGLANSRDPGGTWAAVLNPPRLRRSPTHAEVRFDSRRASQLPTPNPVSFHVP